MHAQLVPARTLIRVRLCLLSRSKSKRTHTQFLSMIYPNANYTVSKSSPRSANRVVRLDFRRAAVGRHGVCVCVQMFSGVRSPVYWSGWRFVLHRPRSKFTADCHRPNVRSVATIICLPKITNEICPGQQRRGKKPKKVKKTKWYQVRLVSLLLLLLS